ncbi:MAG: MCE family protein [Taibaiella sp.]|nr:MCE family protein [Taibaiella sp.]
MKTTPGQKIKIGVFTIVTLLLLLGAIFILGKSKSMFGENFNLVATFKNVSGLQEGNNVRFLGINVGTIKTIEIVSDTLARVRLTVKEEVHKFIKNDAVASIGSDGLMGDKLVNIVSISDTGKIIGNDMAITTVEPTDFTKTLNKINNIADNAEVITYNLAGIATRINEGKGSIGRLLNSDKLAKNLEGTVSSLQEGTQGFSDNMEALKHNFLLKGYYKKKDREKQEKLENAKKAGEEQDVPKTKREERRERRKNKE